MGNGDSTSSWFDHWLPIGLVFYWFSRRHITREGFYLDDEVKYITDDGNSICPYYLSYKFNQYANFSLRILKLEQHDKVRNSRGMLIPFLLLKRCGKI